MNKHVTWAIAAMVIAFLAFMAYIAK